VRIDLAWIGCAVSCGTIVWPLTARALAVTCHRDIKLDNFVIDLDGNIRLVDFGLAKTDLRTQPLSNILCGTPVCATDWLPGRDLYLRARLIG
jgi:serine/threonine protein kinase